MHDSRGATLKVGPSISAINTRHLTKVGTYVMPLILFLFGLLFVASPANAQLVTLSSTNDSLRMVLAGAATTNPVYNVTWSSVGGGQSTQVGSTNGNTAVTALAGPDSGAVRMVNAISVYNADSAAVTLTVEKTVSGTDYVLAKQTIPTGSTMVWTERSGIVITSPTVIANTGTVSGTGVTAAEQGNGAIQKTVFTFTAAPVTVRDTQQGGGVKIYQFPEGRIFILGAVGNTTFTTTTTLASTLHASVSCRWGVGSTTQANATLATTEQDILPVTTFTSSATINVPNTATTSALAAAAQFDGTSAAKSAFFNISVPTGTDIDADATVNVAGSVSISWIWLGDY